MKYSEIIYLINQVEEEDEIGNILPSSETKIKCYAKKQSVRINEFYNAVGVGLSPSCEFVIKKLNYHNEEIIEWNNQRYQVVRTVDPKNKFDIVLICERKIGING